MLVLTRKLQQQIKIGEQITVTVLRIKGNTVRVGVTAPREVRVVRGELPTMSDEVISEELAITTDEAGESAEEAVDEAVAAVPAASHLPLRRIRNRHGAAPLKQRIASCAALAK